MVHLLSLCCCFLLDQGLAVLRWCASCTVPYQTNRHQSLWTKFLIPILDSLVAHFNSCFCQHLMCPVVQVNSPLLGGFSAKEWLPGEGHLLCCTHLLRQKLSEEKLESLSRSALCCFTLRGLKHDFSSNSLKIFLQHCMHDTLDCHQRITVQRWFASPGFIVVFFKHALIVCGSWK